MSERSSETGPLSGSGVGESPGVPLMHVSAYQDEQQRHKADILPNLPSHRFRYSVWHDLSQTEITGDQLKAPRVREGPPIKEEMFYKLYDENHRRIHHSRMGDDRKVYTSQTENWEQAEVANLSYQELGHSYQMEQFLKVLARLKNTRKLNLQEDRLTNLHSLTFPQCEILNLSRNYLPSFAKLPKMPKIRHLDLEENSIEDFKGIATLKNTPIESLNLRRNQIAFTLNYRPRIFQELPQLKILDGLPRRPEDSDMAPDYEHVQRERAKHINSCPVS